MNLKSKSKLNPINRKPTMYKTINDNISSKNFLYAMISMALVTGISLFVFLAIYLPNY